MRAPAPFARQWDRLPEPVRAVVRDEAQVIGKELRSVRRPRDLRRLARDPDAMTRVSEPLAPALDRIITLVARGSLPLGPEAGGIAVAATGLVSATVSSALEICGVLGIEVPPAAAAAAGAAGTVAVGAELVEFYLIACVASNRLRAAGRNEPAVLRRVLLEAYLGPDPASGSRHALARAVLKRTLPRMAPVAGIPVAGVSSWRDLKRADAAVTRILAEPAPSAGA